MFKNVGKAIKGIAKALFILQLVVGGIFAVIVLISGFILSREEPTAILIGVLLFILVAVFTFICAYLSVMTLYAYGCITDDVKTIKEILGNTAGGATNPVIPVPTPDPVHTPEPATIFNPTSWKCSRCGHENALENAFCEECGNKKDI